MMPSDDQPGSNLSESVYQRILSQFRGDWATRLNIDQMFVLIDGVLPFEACLYYQVLPLFLEGNRLHLGMVSPDDTSASEYVRRIVSYLSYSLVAHSISSEALRVVLTAYLNYAGNQPTASRREAVSYGHYRHSSRKPDHSNDPNERLTLVVDSPDHLNDASASEAIVSQAIAPPVEQSRQIQPSGVLEPVAWVPPKLGVNPVDSLTELSGSFADSSAAEAEHIPIPLIAPLTTEAASSLVQDQGNPANRFNLPFSTQSFKPPSAQHSLRDAPASKPIPVQSSAQIPASVSEQALVILNLDAQHLESPVELLATLPPAELLPELLARVLLGGIGRLYFEAYPQSGRVVWSQNGVLQSVLDQLPLDLFEGVLRELQRMAYLPPVPVSQPQQTEIEYLYQQNCVLIRFRFMLGTHGEEATIQVLRGAALKFHQRQQLTKLEHDAMLIAKQLQHKLNEIRVRAYSDPSLLEAKPEKLPKLLELLRSIEQQLEDVEAE